MYGVKISDQCVDWMEQRCVFFVKDWMRQVGRITEDKDAKYRHDYLNFDMNRHTFDGNLKRVWEWYNKQYNLALDAGSKCDLLIADLRNRIFTQNDFGYKFIYRFRTGEIEKVRIDDPNDFLVSFVGYTESFGFGDVSKEAVLEAVTPKFGPWQYY